jgi:arylsulfatase A-like enzyme
MAPNIIVIVADDLAFGDIGHFNGGATHTPHIDALFAGGLDFASAYSASPVCAPARAALLTGRYPHRTGAIDTLEGQGLDRIGLRERTIADALAGAGYRTGIVGKWHNGALEDAYSPTSRGFQSFTGFRGGWMDYWDWSIFASGGVRKADGRYLTEVLGEAGAAFVAEPSEAPFFLWLAFNAPHFPLQAPEGDIARHLGKPGITREVATIYAMVEAMDAAIGRVLAALDATGKREETLVLFTSDNGPDLSGACARPNLGLRDYKGRVYEGGVRVPLALHWPAQFGPARRVEELFHFIDLAPTLLALTGAEPAKGALPFDGRALDLRDAEPRQRFWQWNRYTPVGHCNAAIRQGDWKLVFPPIAAAMRVTPEDLEMDRALKYEPDKHPVIRPGEPERSIPPAGPPQLFNIAEDPGEHNDVAGNHPERVAEMVRALDQWFAEIEADRTAAQ